MEQRRAGAIQACEYGSGSGWRQGKEATRQRKQQKALLHLMCPNVGAGVRPPSAVPDAAAEGAGALHVCSMLSCTVAAVTLLSPNHVHQQPLAAGPQLQPPAGWLGRQVGTTPKLQETEHGTCSRHAPASCLGSQLRPAL